MHFSLRLEDGTEVEDTFGGEPLRFVVGDGTLDPGLEHRLYGLKEGERCQLVLAPGEAYGYPDPANVHTLPRSDFGETLLPVPGTVVGFETPSGRELPGLIREVDEAVVVVDFNHPLAGHRLLLDIHVLAVNAAV
jgi:FKBP-type peptidyl-prolyl cis-trans isomerase SlpA